MDDSCAVCAEPLEWVGYGPCGHREVCSTCVVRLRFVCNDRRCCICKAESDFVFVTKALGDYTKIINDFSVLPSNPTEGQVGNYWYHEDTHAYFDDSDHYKMVKAMCRLSCSECDKMEDQGNSGSKRKVKFRSIEQLKGHLHHWHRLYMCNLCLEGRKIFICEQRLYSRAQLTQHINTGDSEVDGSESERGGFMGHPMCEFCRTPFYGENELYSHMSTEHYTCHICQRQHPGQYEYYKNYDDLEIHFRQEHFLCENEACLAKKFIVFQSESEMKRHNAIEHGGNMSRSKRNAVLQIPTSFQYRRTIEQDRRGRGHGRGRGRGYGYRPDPVDNQLALAIQASIETSNDSDTDHAPSSNTREGPDPEDTVIGPFEPLSQGSSAPLTEYSFPPLPMASTNNQNTPRLDTEGFAYKTVARSPALTARLAESSFPPLPMASSSSQHKPKQDKKGSSENTMAARLRRHKRSVTVLNSAQARPSGSHGPTPSSNGSSLSRPTTTSGFASTSALSTPSKAVVTNEPASSYAISFPARPATAHGLVPTTSASSSWNSNISTRVNHSASAPNLVERGSFESTLSNFPPVSATQKPKLPTNSQPSLDVKSVHTANKSLVERINAALDFDENKYTAFKDISAEFRHGLIDTGEYLAYVHQFGLSHLVPELARLCPDPQKQKELIETYSAFLHTNDVRENVQSNTGARSKEHKSSNKGKGKCIEDIVPGTTSKDILADSIIDTVRKLQLNYKPSEEEVEVLSKDGYRNSKGKSKVLSASNSQIAESRGVDDVLSSSVGSNQNLGNEGGGNKQRKKTSKFHRVRLGDGSVAALLDLRNSEPSPENENEMTDGKKNPSDGLPVRGVWKNGGGQRLKAMAHRNSTEL